MSVKEMLKKITEKSKDKNCFTEEIRRFGEYILNHWVERCAEEANAGNDFLELFAFRGDAYFEQKIKLIHLAKNGLIEYLIRTTELSAVLEEYIVRKDTREVIKIEGNSQINLFNDNIFMHIYVIKLSWA